MTFVASAHDLPLDDEAELVRRARAHDPEVWSMWHDQYYGLVHRYAAARLRSAEDADDVASQVFLEALKSIGRFTYTGKPVLAWLYGIASHVVSRHLRQRSRDAGEPGEAVAASEGFEDASVTSIEVQQALEHLSDEHREVLVLRFVLGLPTKEVAQLLGKTEAATYSLQVRASAALRKRLSRQ
ncbi:MAG TPA: sigma-70 family RNA polymerase sigma factor [Dehalococcoidia bacterium]|nr:sigma-70 family RNA polymerase sigma factor [Dehalococcoidia bacterium]